MMSRTRQWRRRRRRSGGGGGAEDEEQEEEEEEDEEQEEEENTKKEDVEQEQALQASRICPLHILLAALSFACPPRSHNHTSCLISTIAARTALRLIPTSSCWSMPRHARVVGMCCHATMLLELTMATTRLDAFIAGGELPHLL